MMFTPFVFVEGRPAALGCVIRLRHDNYSVAIKVVMNYGKESARGASSTSPLQVEPVIGTLLRDVGWQPELVKYYKPPEKG